MGIAAVDEGADSVALTRLSAARGHPRGMGIAVVATIPHRPTLHLAGPKAAVLFTRRVCSLEVQHHTSEPGQGLVPRSK